MTSLVLVLLGTDHHPFDRLVDWADDAARRDPGRRIVVQHGATRPPTTAEGHEYLPHVTIMQLLAEASAAVCHGGPGTIMDARGHGHVPICVPRDPAYGEHVDGHQKRFAAVAHGAGVVTAVETIDEFHAALDGVLGAARIGRPGTLAVSPATDAARALVALELDRLVEAWAPGGPPRSLPLFGPRSRTRSLEV